MAKTILLLFTFFCSMKLAAQELQSDSASSRWKFSVWAETFIIPGEEDFFNPTLYVRHKNLHLEGRYNYEDRNTASIWAGRRFKFGRDVEFVFVPMAAVVFGNMNGLAPGLETEIMYKKFDFYSESEYVFDFKEKDNNFFYMYTELAIRPIRPLRMGLIAQHTKLVETKHEVQRGIFGEYYFGRFRVGLFYFSPFASDNYWIASASVDF